MGSESFHLTKIFIYFADFAHAHTHAHMKASKQASKLAWSAKYFYPQCICVKLTFQKHFSRWQMMTILMLVTGSHSISSWHFS